MKIGIIIHSKTGHTLSVAEKLKERFIEGGHQVLIEKIEAAHDGEANVDKVKLSHSPKTDELDLIIFGAPVRGFMLSPVMQAYLQQISSLQNKRVAVFVTQALPSPTLGGKQAIMNFNSLCHAKGAEVKETSVINWTFPSTRKKMINETVEKFSRSNALGFHL